jgi:hypothetical protein
MARLGVRPMLQTKSLITRPAQSQGLRLSTSATTFSQSAGPLWTYGEPMLAEFLQEYPKTAEAH